MAEVKAYIQANKTASFTCPSCKDVKVINTAKIPGHKNKIKVRCNCKEVVTVHLEYRRFFRKEVNLQGTYVIRKNGQGGGSMTVKDISMGGIGFMITGVHNVKKGQVLEVSFHLSDKHMTLINKEVEVMIVLEQKNSSQVTTIFDHKIGGQFLDGDDLGKDLGFFLRT